MTAADAGRRKRLAELSAELNAIADGIASDPGCAEDQAYPRAGVGYDVRQAANLAAKSAKRLGLAAALQDEVPYKPRRA